MRLTVVNNLTGEVILTLPLVDYALLVKGENVRDMDDQEFLDRMDEYVLLFVLDEGMLAPGATAASCGRASDDPTPPQQEGVEVGFRISLDDPAGTRAASQSRAGYDNGTSVD